MSAVEVALAPLRAGRNSPHESDPRRRWWADLHLGDGGPAGERFSCPLPGHKGAAWIGLPSGEPHRAQWVLNCECQQRWFSLAEVYAAGRRGAWDAKRKRPHRLSPPELWTWNQRIDHEAGIVVRVPAFVPAPAGRRTRAVEAVRAGIGLLVAIRADSEMGIRFTFSGRFAAAWCEVDDMTAWRITGRLVESGVLRIVGEVEVRGGRATTPLYELVAIEMQAPGGPSVPSPRDTTRSLGSLASSVDVGAARCAPRLAPRFPRLTVPEEEPTAAGWRHGRPWTPPGDFGPEVVLALDGSSCRTDGHAGAWEWRSRNGRYWTCTSCFGPPADLDAVEWGQTRPAQGSAA